MSIKDSLVNNPYYDDFDEDKQFVKILFRPGYAVQARELTQLQSILQNQISRFGKHIFKNGSMVLGGQTLYENTDVFYLKVNLTDLNGSTIDVENFLNKYIVDSATGSIRALVVAVQESTDSTDNTLVIKYFSSGTFGNSTDIQDESGEYFATTVTSSATGASSIVSIGEGVFFYDDFFVKVLDQTIILDAYGTTPSYRIGLELIESIVDENSDSSLLDPALEASNYQAPGATRYKIELTLAKRSLTSTDDTAFIDLVRIENGTVKQRLVYPQYAMLEDTLARRTFDESGNYTVRPFTVTMTDDVVSNNGNGFANSYNLIVSPGKAYVRGYEFETIAPTTIVSKRAQDSANVTNHNQTFNYQNYIDVTNLSGPINFQDFTTLNVHCVPAASIATTNTDTIMATDIGTIRIRALDYQYGANTTSIANGVFRAYVFDSTIGSKIGRASGGTANTIILDQLASTANDSYRGAKIRLLATANEYNANSFSNTIMHVSGVSSKNIAVGNRVFGPGINVASYISSINTSTNLVTLSANTQSSLTLNSFAFIAETNYGEIDTKIIDSYNGVNRTASIGDSTWANTPNTSFVYSLDFQFRDAESFVANTGTTIHTKINISDDSKYSILVDDYEGAYLTETNFNSLIWKLPHFAIKENSISGIEYYARQLYSGTFSANVLTFSTDTGIQSIVTGSPISGSDAVDNFLVVLRGGTPNGLANNTVINFLDPSNTVASDGTTITVTVPGAGAAVADVYMKIDIPTTQPANIRRRKLKKSANSSIVTTTGGEVIVAGNASVLFTDQVDQPGVQLLLSSNNITTLKTPNEPQSLYVSDIITLVAVKDFGANTATTANLAYAADITASYRLDNGQRDNSYEHASISLIAGETAPTGNVAIFADYYKHEGYGYFSVDSYENDAYADIPTYVSPNSGESYKLRDCFDFRLSKQSGLNGLRGKYNEIYLGISGTSAQFNYAYYLPRIDKLVVTKNKTFDIINGASSLTPIPPKDRDDAMTIYTLILPAYTGETEQIKARFVQNRRYTMRDIGELEQRIQNIEYYSTLNFLEKEAIQEQFLDDSTGLPRVKTGVVVDPFTGYKIADVSSEDYNAAIDIQNGEVRPSIRTKQFRFVLEDYEVDYNTEGELNTTFNATSKIVTPAFTANTFIQQPLVSFTNNINPFSLDVNYGTAEAEEIDPEYPDLEQPPEIIDNTNGINDSWAYCSQNFRDLRSRSNLNSIKKEEFECYRREWGWWYNRIKADSPHTAKKLEKEITKLTKEGLYDSNFDDFINSLTAEVLNGASKPSDLVSNLDSLTTMLKSVNLRRRRKNIYFRAKGLKPNRLVTTYLNDVNVSNFVLKPDVIQIEHDEIPNSAHWLKHWTHDFRNGEIFKVRIESSGKVIARGTIDYIERVSSNVANIHVYVTESGEDALYNNKDTERVLIPGDDTYIRSGHFGKWWNKKNCSANNKIIAYYPGFSMCNVVTANTVQVTGKFANSNVSFTNNTITVVSGDGAGKKYNVASYNVQTRTITISGTFNPLPGGMYNTYTDNRGRTRNVRDEDRSMITIGDCYTDGRGTFPGLLMSPSIVENDDELGLTINRYNKNRLKFVTANTESVYPPAPKANSAGPFAQTFIVDENIHPQGLSITSVKLLFAAIDDSLPVNIQIRQTTPDGIPFSSGMIDSILPGASIYLNPSDITVISNTTISQMGEFEFNPFYEPGVSANTSATAGYMSLANSAPYYTEATFSQPIFLDPGKSYALAITSASGEYELYMARLGDKILGTNRLITAQPYVGTLFKIQNSSVWEPFPNEDIAFELTKATYDVIPAVFKMRLRARPQDLSNYGLQGIELYDATAPSSNVNVNALYITTEENAYVNANASYKIRTTYYDGTQDIFRNIETDTNIEFYDDFGPRIITSNNQSFILEATLKTINPDIAPSLDISKINMVTIENIIDNNAISNSDIFITNPGQDHNVMTVSVAISGGGGTGATATANVVSGQIDDIYITNTGSGYTGSPTITITDSNATILAEAVIIGEDQPFGGVGDAKYITRKITLADGFDGGDIRVLFSAHKPRNTEIDVYYKVLSQDDADSLTNKRWTLMTLIGGLNSYSENKNEYKNYMYAPGSNNIADNYINYDGFTNFKYFAIKLVFRSTNSNKVPRVKNFRAIALSELL